MTTKSIERPPRKVVSGRPVATEHSIGIAGIKVVKAPETIRTVLGSCIGIALYDESAKIGGLAHVILPSSEEGSGDPGKFADTAVNMLLDELLLAGARQEQVKAKITGGAAMFGSKNTKTLGQRNSDAVEAQLKHRKIPLLASAVGGTKGRKMHLNPATGDVTVMTIGDAPQVI